MRITAALLLLSTCAGADSWLLLGGERIGGEPDIGGRQMTADWIGQTDQTVWTAGVSDFELNETRWRLARASISRPISDSLRWNAMVDIGPGSTNNDEFLFRKTSAAMNLRLHPDFSVEGKHTYINVAPSSGQLIGLAATWNSPFGLQWRAGASGTISGNLGASSWLVRVDDFRRTHWFAGFSRGRTDDPRLLDFPTPTMGGSHSVYDQWFAGVDISLGRATLQLSADLIRQGGVRRQTVRFGVKLPLTAAPRGAGPR